GTETGAGDGGARPARGDRYGWAGATRDGSVGATVTTTDAAAATTGITTAGEWCVAMQVAQDPAARRSRCVCALAATGTVSNATMSSARSEEHTSELQSLAYLVCRLLLEK